jgi:hypothetical protein
MRDLNPELLLNQDPCFAAMNPHTQDVVETMLVQNYFDHLDSGAPLITGAEALLAEASCLYNLSSSQLREIRFELLRQIGPLL